MKVSLGLCLALPLLSACAATGPSLVAVDTECKSGRREMLRSNLVFFERNSTALAERQRKITQNWASVFKKKTMAVL